MQDLPVIYLERARQMFAEIDALLGQARHMLDPLETASPFHGAGAERPPVTFQILRDEGLRLRDTMAQLLRSASMTVSADHQSQVEVSRRLLEHAITVAAGLSPEHWEASEELSEAARQDARRWASVVLGALRDIAAELDEPPLRPRPSAEDSPRHDRQIIATDDLALRLRTIAQRHHLHHVRRRLDILARRHDRGELRIAVAGRCNVGKSSLINHLVARPILPAGPLPTTCVPVYLRFGHRTRGEVCYPDAAAEPIDVARLPEFSDRRANPGNRRHVQSVSLEIDSPGMARDVVWIDMPPLDDDAASLSSFAYLDELLACHVVVIVASAIVPVWNVEIQLIERLCRAGVRVLVVLSKTDLLPEGKLMVHERCMTDLWQATGVRAPVGMVSVNGDAATMCDTWRDTALSSAIQESRDNEDGAEASALLALRMETLSELERRARVLSACTAEPSNPASVGAAAALVQEALRQDPDTEVSADRLLHQTIRNTAHNAAGLSLHDRNDTVDLSEMLAATANALASSEAISWWKELLALRAQASLLIAQSPEDAWRWPQVASLLPVPRRAPPFDCRTTLPCTLIHRLAAGEFSRWVAAHAMAKRLLSQPSAAMLRDALSAYLRMLKGWRHAYLDRLAVALQCDDQLGHSHALLRYRERLRARLAQDIARLSPH